MLLHTMILQYKLLFKSNRERKKKKELHQIIFSYRSQHSWILLFVLENSVPNVCLFVNPAAYSCIHEGNAFLVFSIPKHSSPLTMPRLTNLNCSLTHWNSIQTSSELLISQQNLLPNLPFLEHLSGHRHKFPSSFQQYLEKINITLFVCFSLSSYTTEKLLSTRKQPTFPLSDQKRNNLPWKFMNQTALLPHILVGSKTQCVSASAAGTTSKAQEDITCWFSCIYTMCNPLSKHLFPEDQKSAPCLILPEFTASTSSCK